MIFFILVQVISLQSFAIDGKPISFCRETQPSSVRAPIQDANGNWQEDVDVNGTPRDPDVQVPLSVELSTSCGGNTNVTDTCAMAVRCTYLQPLTFRKDPKIPVKYKLNPTTHQYERDYQGNDVTINPEDFSKLSDFDKNSIIAMVDADDIQMNNYLASINQRRQVKRTIKWIPAGLTCQKFSVLDGDGKPYVSPKTGNTRFCPRPDQCKFPEPKTQVNVGLGEFLPRDRVAMAARQKIGVPKVFQLPALNTVDSAGKAVAPIDPNTLDASGSP